MGGGKRWEMIKLYKFTFSTIDSFECGLHVVVNTNILLNKLNFYNIESFDQCINGNKRNYQKFIQIYILQILTTSQMLLNLCSEKEKSSFVNVKQSKKNNTPISVQKSYAVNRLKIKI